MLFRPCPLPRKSGKGAFSLGIDGVGPLVVPARCRLAHLEWESSLNRAIRREHPPIGS